MELTRKQAIGGCREMWNWIAKKIEKKKRCLDISLCKLRFLVTKGYTTYPKNGCFLCEYVWEMKKGCPSCPVKNTHFPGDGCLGGLYRKVCSEKDWQEQAALARKIANLPERKEEE